MKQKRRSETKKQTSETKKLTEQIRSVKFFMILHVKVKISYLLQCQICKLHYVRKSETIFNIRMNNNRKDVKSEKSILTCKHFNERNHSFQFSEFT